MTDEPSTSHELLTCEEAAAYLRVRPRTVYRLLREGACPGVKVGRQWRIRRADLEACLAPQRPAGTPDRRDAAHAAG